MAIEFVTRRWPYTIRRRDSGSKKLTNRQLRLEAKHWRDAYPVWWATRVKAGAIPQFYSYRFVLDQEFGDIEVTPAMISRVDQEIGQLLRLCTCSLDAHTDGFITEFREGNISLEHWAEHVFASFYDYLISYIRRRTGQEWFKRSFYTVQSKTSANRFHTYVYQEAEENYDLVVRVALQTQNYVCEILEETEHSKDPIMILTEMTDQLMPRSGPRIVST